MNVIRIQGVYYLLSGLWPIVHMSSFLIVTGPKTDLWLVRTVGLLISVIGADLIASSGRAGIADKLILSCGSALALFSIDVIYVWKGVIPPVYLLDAAAEAVLLCWVITAAVRHRGFGGASSD